MNKKTGNWIILNEKRIYDNPWISVTEFDVLNPGGKAGIKHLKGVSKPAGGDNGQNTKSTLGR